MAEEVDSNEIKEAAAAGAPTEATADASASVEAPEPAAQDEAETATDSADDAVADDSATPAADDEAGETGAPVAAGPVEPEVQLTPKQRKAATKATKSAKTSQTGALSPEERQVERDAARVKKAAARRVERAHTREKHKAGAHGRAATPPRPHETGIQKTRQGVVVSDKADKTITVRIDVARRHRLYAKIVRTSTTVHAHDERNDASLGDTVIVRESRPLSRSKRWRLVEIVERAR